MKIKKLTLRGFKSFQDRLEISFPMGISAVVGPNGCGKSNIVDAIRWGMGEQSAKQLRGRQMEDVIFNGTGDHKPFGMAEVSILFENGDGSFPAEFANENELSITRRLFRSGESEYRINNVSCRLKDIHEIFMDTGLGSKAYSIIGQGKISTIIEQKPEETRIMLDEAAGITKYRKKVDESHRKIESTKKNLQRVEDILIEVQKQMGSLKRQASKAKRFKTIGKEIQRLEVVLNANAYNELSEESSNRVKSIDDLVREDIAQSTEFSSIQAGTENMSLELDEKDKEVSHLRNEYLHLKEALSKEEAALESLIGKKRMREELGGRLRKEKDELGEKLVGLREEKNTLNDRIEGLDQAAATLKEEIAMLDKRLKGRSQLLKEAKEEFERARTKVNSGMSEEMGLNRESGFLNERIGEISDSRSRLENEKDDVDTKFTKINDASRKKNQVREALVLKFEEIKNDFAGERLKCDDLNRKKEQIEADLKTAESEMNISQSRLTSLRSLSENYEGYKVGVRTIMKADDLKARRIGIVADIIQVETKYELAVETVLADKLQYVIVERQSDGKEAVDYLKVRAKGRSNFVPLMDLNSDETNNENKNNFPLLRDVVTIQNSYQALFDTLLGNAAIVADMDQAISAWNNNGKDQCFVTLEGDMVDKRGVISGGKLAHTSHGLLSRKREIKELEKKTSVFEKNIAELKMNLNEVIMEAEKKEAYLGKLTEEKFDCQEKISDLDKVIFRLGHELDQLEKLSERISDELEQKSSDQARHGATLNKVEEALQLCKEKIRQEKGYLIEKEAELKDSENEFEQFRDNYERLKLNYNLSQEEKRGLIREIERIDDYAEEARQKLEGIENDIITGQEKIQEYLREEKTIHEKLEEVYKGLGHAEESVNRAEQERNEFHGKIREEEKRGETLRRELEILKEKINRAKLEQSEIGFKMESLIELIKGKFDLDLAEIYKEHLENDFSSVEAKNRLEHQKKLKERLGDVNLTAIQEHEALKERHTFILEQKEDLLKSIDSLNKAINKINRISLEKFWETFNDVDKKLKQVFPILFNGGTAGLKMTDETNPLESGVLVLVHPPGKKLSHMGLLSGGEKALVAMALIFAIYLIKPSPFCLLDEVDSPLDDANIDRFNSLLGEIKKYSQVILVTHNRKSMEIVDSLYGVTMEKPGISKMVSVNLQGFNN